MSWEKWRGKACMPRGWASSTRAGGRRLSEPSAAGLLAGRGASEGRGPTLLHCLSGILPMVSALAKLQQPCPVPHKYYLADMRAAEPGGASDGQVSKTLSTGSGSRLCPFSFHRDVSGSCVTLS